ncbi:hypothetical protein LIER_41830 [Lithospermum erythrorhizon]|uniref:Uncharacterized protein n=1 Tax=Lithospermum erythrorhizon TaxID=34254 RepID=A0AAV3RG65_LITER
MAPSVGNANIIPQNQNTSTTPTTEQPQINVDIHGSFQPGPAVPPTFTDKNPIGDIREEIQRRVRLAREKEIQQHVDLILERDSLIREEQERLNTEAARAEEEVRARESNYTDDPPYTPTYTPLYTSSMFPQYGDTRTDSYRPSEVQQTVPQMDPHTTLLQELLAAQKREFDEFIQMVVASIPRRPNRVVTHAVMPFTRRLNVVPIPVGLILP